MFSVPRYEVFLNHTLKVANVQSEDSSEYSCEVITKMDHVHATGSITVVGVCVCMCVLWCVYEGVLRCMKVYECV